MTEGVILDTGPLAAYLIESDDYHQWAVERFASLPPLFWTCEAVVTETAYLIGSDTRALKLIRQWLENDWLRLPFQFAVERTRVFQLMEQYRSVPMSFADGCLVRMAEILDDCPILTVDGDFRIYRKNRRQPMRTMLPSDKQ